MSEEEANIEVTELELRSGTVRVRIRRGALGWHLVDKVHGYSMDWPTIEAAQTGAARLLRILVKERDQANAVYDEIESWVSGERNLLNAKAGA